MSVRFEKNEIIIKHLGQANYENLYVMQLALINLLKTRALKGDTQDYANTGDLDMLTVLELLKSMLVAPEDICQMPIFLNPSS